MKLLQEISRDPALELAFLHYFFDFNIAQAMNMRHQALPIKWNNLSKRKSAFWPHWKQKDSIEIATAAEIFLKDQKRKPRKFVSYLCKPYPVELAHWEKAPPVLYYLGNIDLLQKLGVCVVGSRHTSPLGISTTNQVVRALVEIAGVQVISGFARGIDIEAHKLTYSLNGSTVAVLGSGINKIYPKEHERYLDKFFGSQFLLLSEFSPNCPPLPRNFPRRNVLMARLSAGVVCIEGSPKSGSLITGRASLNLGKTTCVFTQDYRSEHGQGCIELIRLGAEPVVSMQDMLEKLAFPLGGKLGAFPQKRQECLDLSQNSKALEFSITDYANANGLNIGQAIAEIEEKIELGEVRRVPYRNNSFLKNH